jgi:hypothetical protein
MRQLQTQHNVDIGNSIKDRQNKDSSHIILIIQLKAYKKLAQPKKRNKTHRNNIQ